MRYLTSILIIIIFPVLSFCQYSLPTDDEIKDLTIKSFNEVNMIVGLVTIIEKGSYRDYYFPVKIKVSGKLEVYNSPSLKKITVNYNETDNFHFYVDDFGEWSVSRNANQIYMRLQNKYLNDTSFNTNKATTNDFEVIKNIKLGDSFESVKNKYPNIKKIPNINVIRTWPDDAIVYYDIYDNSESVKLREFVFINDKLVRYSTVYNTHSLNISIPREATSVDYYSDKYGEPFTVNKGNLQPQVNHKTFGWDSNNISYEFSWACDDDIVITFQINTDKNKDDLMWYSIVHYTSYNGFFKKIQEKYKSQY